MTPDRPYRSKYKNNVPSKFLSKMGIISRSHIKEHEKKNMLIEDKTIE